MSLFGELYLHCPQDAELPGISHVNIRVSWYPAHGTVHWLDGGATYRKLPHRAPEAEPSICRSLRYDATVFTDQHRRDFPEAFVEYPAPPRPDDATSPVVTGPSKNDTVHSTSHDPTQGKLPTKKEEEEEEEYSHESEEEWEWEWDWGASDWSKIGHWPEPKRNSRFSSTKSPTPSEKSTPTFQPVIVTPQPEEPGPTNVVASSQEIIPETSVTVSAPISPVAAVSAPQVVTTTVTQRPAPSAHLSSDSRQILMELQTLSLTGPPPTRGHRLARQALAIQLSLSPGLYNLLVFGEPLPTPGPDGTVRSNHVIENSVRHSQK